MADPLYNATARIRRGKSYLSGMDSLARTHGEEAPEEVRCSLRQLSAQAAQGIFGAHQVEAWACRLVAASAIPNGSMIEVRGDGEEDWQEYRVQTSRKVSRATNLLVTRV